VEFDSDPKKAKTKMEDKTIIDSELHTDNTIKLYEYIKGIQGLYALYETRMLRSKKIQMVLAVGKLST
jgi:hypothetical protein